MDVIEIGNDLSAMDIHKVAHGQVKVSLPNHLKSNVQAAYRHLQQAVQNGETIYGVTTNFGGMAKQNISSEYASFIQENLLKGLKCGVGKRLPVIHVRAAMLILANALSKGVSGIRFELIERIILFLNADITPIIYDCGSIGASGDLIPMSYIAGCIIGLSSDYKLLTGSGKKINALSALKQLGLKPLTLHPKEGLALVNSTAMMTGIAINCVEQFKFLFELSLTINAFFFQALQGNIQSLDPFVHQCKPHPGQIFVAAQMRELLSDSKFVANHSKKNKKASLVQDRYSIRCLAQYLGVIADGLGMISKHAEIEANSATDNPLIDESQGKIFHSGNFLGEYIGVGMDQLRYYLGLLIKYLDVQIAMLVSPEFNNGLPDSLHVDENNPVKFGLKGLQICANSLMPLILHQANPIAPLYPTHAEQFNQNINSQGFSSAVLAWKALDLAKSYLSISLIFAIQAVDLRCHEELGNYNTCDYLSPSLTALYETVYKLIGAKPNSERPLINSKNPLSIDQYIKHLYNDLSLYKGELFQAISD